MTLAPRHRFIDTPLELVATTTQGDYPLRDIENGINNRCPGPSARVLLDFQANVERRGGLLRFSGFGRSYDVSAQAYTDWQAGLRTSRANPPGESRHNSWMGVDVDVEGSGLSKAELDDAALESGLRPISNEGWHYDIVGDFWHVRERHGPAVEATCCCLDAGLDWFGLGKVKALQAGLHRVGEDVGGVDGLAGPLLYGALDALKLPRTTEYRDLYGWPSAQGYRV